MATRLEQMLVQRSCQKSALSESRRELRALQAQAVRGAKAQARHWQLDSHARRVTLIAYGLADYEVEASVVYLAALGRQRSWPPRPKASLASAVEDEFLAVDEHECAALMDFSNPADPPAPRAAIEVVEEWRIAVWARRWVLASGATVPTASVLRRYHANRLLLPVELRPPCRGTVDEQRARKWVGRWRARWGGYYGKLPVREPLPVETAFGKAADATRTPLCISVRLLISRA